MLTAWNAFPMLDRLFDDVLHDVTGAALGTTSTQSMYNPAIDVRTNEDQIVFVCDVSFGRSYGAFANRCTLPDYVDPERVTADLTDGVLTITVPKQPKARPRRIEIGGASGRAQQIVERQRAG